MKKNKKKSLSARFQAMDGLENVVIGLGTPRDKHYYTRYTRPSLLEREELDNMYRSSWLAKRIVDTVADDMTRAWRTFTIGHTQEERDGNEDQVHMLEQEEESLALRRSINEALRWARLYGGAFVYLGLKGESPQAPLDVQAIKKGDLQYVHVLDRWRWDVDQQPIYSGPHSLFFGLPEYYHLKDLDTLVHCTRLLRFQGESLPFFAWKEQGMWDDSVLQHLSTSLAQYDTACSALATMLLEANVDVIQVDGLADILAADGGEQRMVHRFAAAARMKSFNRTFILDSAEHYEKKSNNFQNLDKIVNTFMCDVCGGADIPFTRLFGQSATGFQATGDNDIRQYYDMISAKQERSIRPQLSYFDEILTRSVMGVKPKGLTFQFNPLWQMTHIEKAQVSQMTQ